MPTITGATRALVDSILKDDYLGPVRDNLNSTTLLHNRIHRDEENVVGRIAKIPLRIGRNRGIQAVREGGLLPNPGYQRYTTVEVPMAYNYGLVQVTGQAMAASRTDLGAFIRVLDQEIRGMVEDLKVDQNRQEFSDGSGRLGIIDAAPVGAVIPVRHLHDFNDKAETLKYLEPGDRIGFEDISASSAVKSFVTGDATGAWTEIVSVDLAGKTVTVGAAALGTGVGDAIIKGPDAITVALNDSQFRGQSGGTAGDKKEMMGLVGIVNGPNGWPIRSTGTYTPVFGVGGASGDVYAGVNGGSVVVAKFQNYYDSAIWRAQVNFNNGVLRTISTNDMQKVFDACEEQGMATPTIGICSYPVRRVVVDMLVPDRRFIGTQVYELDGGFEAIDFNKVPIVPEKDCPPSCLLFLHEPVLRIYRMSDYTWLDKDGSILKYVDRRDAWEAVLANYSEFGTWRRNCHGVLGDIATD